MPVQIIHLLSPISTVSCADFTSTGSSTSTSIHKYMNTSTGTGTTIEYWTKPKYSYFYYIDIGKMKTIENCDLYLYLLYSDLYSVFLFSPWWICSAWARDSPPEASTISITPEIIVLFYIFVFYTFYIVWSYSLFFSQKCNLEGWTLYHTNLV